MTERIFETRSGLIVQSEDLNELKKRLPRHQPGVQSGFRSFLAVPLVSRDKVFGALLFRSKHVNAYTDRDVALAERVADQIAGAIANARLYAENQRSENEARRLAEEEAVLAEIGRTISSSLDIDEVYERFAEQVHKLVLSDRVVITLLNPGQGTFTIA